MRLHRPSGLAVVTLDGRDIYLGAYGTPQAQQAYERQLMQWKAVGLIPQQGQSSLPITIIELVDAFWQHVERDGLYVKNGRKTSEQSCMRVALRPLVRLFGMKPAAAFGPVDLLAVRQALCRPQPPPAAGEKRRRVHTQPIVRASVNKHLHRIRIVFRWATAMQLVPVGVWQALLAVDAIRRGQATSTREPEPVRPANLRAVATVLRNASAPIAAMIRLQWLTGMRPGEVVQLRLGDIERAGTVWVYRPGTHKTEHRDRAREVMLGPRAQRVLTPFLSLDPAAYFFPGDALKGRGRKPMHEDAYCRAITRKCEELAVERWTPNRLRHNAATRFRKASGIEAALLQTLQCTRVDRKRNAGLIDVLNGSSRLHPPRDRLGRRVVAGAAADRRQPHAADALLRPSTHYVYVRAADSELPDMRRHVRHCQEAFAFGVDAVAHR